MWLVPLSLAFSLPAPAAFGATLRLDVPGGSMEGLPVYNQIGNTCYAYSAGVAVDAVRNRKNPLKPRERTNPLELAIGNGQLENGQIRFRDTVAQGGFCQAVHYAEKEGICSLEELPLKGEDGGRLSALFKELRMLQKRFGELSRDERNSKEGREIRERVIADLHEYGLERHRIPSSDELSRLLLKTPQEFQRAVLSDPWCEGRRTEVSLPRRCHDEMTVYESAEKILERITSRLKKKDSLPVAIAYCAKVLRKGKHYRGFSHRIRDFDLPDVDHCTGHVSLVTGKRHHPESGRLQLLVHNSWGEQCKGYSDDWDCDDGKIWVDAEVLAENTYGVAWFVE